MKALVIDDERLARSELIRMLEAFPDLRVIGEAVNADDAAEKVRSLEPDVLFLDIEMPGTDVFSMLESLERAPHVIFTTAFNQYAIQAFECNALDYLLKPVDARRLSQAVEKLRRIQGPARPPGDDRPRLREEDRIFLRDGNRCWFVRMGEIRLFESEGNYARLHLDAPSRPLVLRSLNTLQRRLDPRVFFRVSRKHIVNVRWITSVAPAGQDRLEITLDGRLTVVASRRQSLEFKLRMEL
ncbi:MAG: response regulator transcription factor [Acidobacteria bacterium]|nr:response regulator transcription factor [Acidobacteriota bacterium]